MTTANFTATGSTLAEVEANAQAIAETFFAEAALQVRVKDARLGADGVWTATCWALPLTEVHGVVVNGMYYAHERFVPKDER